MANGRKKQLKRLSPADSTTSGDYDMSLKRSGISRSPVKVRRCTDKVTSHCQELEPRMLLSLAFGNSVPTSVINLYRGVQTANINTDSNVDVVVGTQASGSGHALTGTAILISNGDGTFSPTSNPPAMPSSSGTINPFIVGNFTSDSQADLLYLTEDNSGGATNSDLVITPELNSDDNPGTFTAFTPTDVAPQSGTTFDPLAVVAGNFMDDGNQDLAVLGATSGGQELVILEGNGDGTFELSPAAPFLFPSNGFNGGDQLLAGNFMGTGNLDIAIYSSTTGSLDIIQNEASGTFQQMPPVTLAKSNFTVDGATIAAGNFNGDAATDLVVSDNIGSDDSIDVYLSNSDGTFAAPITANDGNSDPGVDFNGAITTADFDNDGNTDVADDFGVLLGNGTGELAAPVAGLALGSGTGTEFAAIAAADFDGNNIPDLAGISLTGKGFEATLNTTPQTTTTTLNSPSATSPLGQQVTLTATITASSAIGTPTGTVTFLDGTSSMGSAPLLNPGNNGVFAAEFQTSSLTSGVHSITASYSGDASFDASTSDPFSLTVTETTNTTLVATSATANIGAIATFTATVSPSTPGGAVPTGTVSFFQGSTDIGDIPLDGTGVAKFGTTSLPAGQNSIIAEYAGDNTYASSNSAPLTETINDRPTGAANLVPTITGAKLPSAGVVGGKIKASVPVVVTNQGTAAVKGKITINVFVSTSASLDSTATMLFTLTRNASISAGKSATFPVSITSIPKTLANGTYDVLVQVLDTAGFGNFTASAGAMQLSTPFISLSDSFTALNLPGSVTGGTKTTAAATLELDNFGNVTAVGPATIELFTSTDLNLDSADAKITTMKVNLNIGSDRLQRVRIPLKLIPNVASGAYFVLAQVTDPDKNVTQAATLGTVQITQSFVSLSATVGSVSSSSIKIGSTGTIAVSITNNGNAVSNGPMTIVLGLTSNGFSQTATLVTLTQKVNVKIGGTVVLHLKFKVPTTATAGTYLPTATITDAAQNSTGLIVGSTQLTLD
jgi:Bacterial Ig-like domain (group 3)